MPVESIDYTRVLPHVTEPHPSVGVRESVDPVHGRNLVADMFAALFAAEQGETVTPGPPLHDPLPDTPVAVTESLVDEVTRRVVERLAPGAANELVAQIVSEVAERLIREEIARIKTAAAARL
jgi:hypothetical protein